MKSVIALFVCIVCVAANAAELSLVPVIHQAQQRNPSPVPQEPAFKAEGKGGVSADYVLPYRNDQAAAQGATALGINALLDSTNRNGAMLNELLQLERSRLQAGPSAPAVISPPAAAPEDKPSIGERIKDRVEDRKEAVKEKVDALTESPLARALFFVAIAAVVLWIAISQHRKAGTPTHIARAMDYVATATAGVPVLSNITAAADKLTDNVGDKIRELQIKMDEHKKAQAELKKQVAVVSDAALAASTTAQAAAQVVTANQRTGLS
jgi:hypothetical protein